MSKFRRIALSVFAIGVCAAAPFYRAGEPVPPASQERTNQYRQWQGEELTLQVATRREASPASQIAIPEPALVETPEVSRFKSSDIRAHPQDRPEPPLVRGHPTLRSEPPPRLARHFEPVPSRPLEPESSFSLAPGPVLDRPLAIESEATSSEPPPSNQILHRIVDGDSLEGISQKYFGTRNRAKEIFEANRTVLDDPEVLPLGEDLIIRLGEAEG